ncbi:MAG: TraR/DksA family transcriptional regulator [Planctomycetota bacterium]
MAKKMRPEKAGAKKTVAKTVSAAPKASASKAPVAKVVKKPVLAPPPAPVKGPKIKCPLSKAELKEFQQILLQKRRALIGDMNGIEADALKGGRGGESSDLSNMPTHPADVGTDNYEQEFTLGLLESERTLLAEINEALERIDAGTFGICAGTGKAISTARLRARPWAKYSIEYARLIEQGLVRAQHDHDEESSGEEGAEEVDDEDEDKEPEEEEEPRETEEDFDE